MQQKQRQKDTERDPDVVMYHRADCVDGPDDDRRIPPVEHFRSREVAVGGDPVQTRELFEELIPDSCSCGAEVETDFRTVEWPAIPMTGEAAIGLFERTDGYVVLRVEALSYPEDPIDWQGVLGMDDFQRDREWYLGVVDDRLIARTRIDHEPVWESTELTPSDLGVVLRKLPSEPKSIWGTEIEPALEDYQAGHDIISGVPVPEVA